MTGIAHAVYSVSRALPDCVALSVSELAMLVVAYAFDRSSLQQCADVVEPSADIGCRSLEGQRHDHRVDYADIQLADDRRRCLGSAPTLYLPSFDERAGKKSAGRDLKSCITKLDDGFGGQVSHRVRAFHVATFAADTAVASPPSRNDLCRHEVIPQVDDWWQRLAGLIPEGIRG